MKNFDDVKKKMPDIYWKIIIVGGVGGIIGAAMGGYVSVEENNYVYTGVGAGIGVIVGYLIGFFAKRKLSLKILFRIDKYLNYFIGILSCLFAFLCFLVLLKGKWIGLVGIGFFGLCGIYLLRIRQL